MDMSNMFGKIKEMQAKMKEVQDNLDQITAEGEAGGGMVKAVVNGKKKLLSILIEESLMDASDREMVQDLIVAATNIALQNVEVKANEEIKKDHRGYDP
jgi:DNA-binding YbaB/EbfC family protein